MFIKIKDWVLRNLTWIIIAIAGLIFISPTYELIHKLVLIVVLEALAIGLSGVALYSFTKVNFIKKLVDEDKTKSDSEILSYGAIIGLVFLGVHILVAGTWYILTLGAV